MLKEEMANVKKSSALSVLMLAEVRCSGRAVRITSDELVDFNITRI
jgi:hypothetical protein